MLDELEISCLIISNEKTLNDYDYAIKQLRKAIILPKAKRPASYKTDAQILATIQNLEAVQKTIIPIQQKLQKLLTDETGKSLSGDNP